MNKEEKRRAYQKAYQKKWRKSEKGKAYRKEYQALFILNPRIKTKEEKKKDRIRAKAKGRKILGIDGEGLTEGGEHKYMYMAAWDSTKQCRELDLEPYFDAGMSKEERTKECLEFILSLPQNALVFGFSLGYDYTKILEGLPDKTLYEIARPELRPGKNGPVGRMWGDWEENGDSGWYRLNLVKGRFSVSKISKNGHKKSCSFPACKGCKVLRKTTIWDIFAFFQGAFIKACKEWGVVTEREYEQLKAMKDKRNLFERKDLPAIREYCGQECQKLALLAERLLEAHEDAGLKLISYYGAGSTASRMLKVKFNAKEFIASPPPEMEIPVGCGFFGGRFEISKMGPIREKMWAYDIASAYPYQFTFLPCLKCGRWELVRGEGLQAQIEKADIALVRYRLPVVGKLKISLVWNTSETSWGPFPLRTFGLNAATPGGDGPLAALSELPSNGCIVYPVSSGGGWVYRDEFLTGQKYFPNVVAVEAWIYSTNCSHSPFNDKTGERSSMPEQYITRLQWGKDGRGIVVKSGTNSCYGKTAQSIGTNPPFQCFVYAGMVTSGCRAQILETMCSSRVKRFVIGTATDGLFATRELTLPEPRDTGTREAAALVGKLPLGAWETKVLEDGMMSIRPGIAFPLNSAIEAEVKARGIGKAILSSFRAEVLEKWEKEPGKTFHVTKSLFHGLRSATAPGTKSRPWAVRRDNYGKWSDVKQQVNYDPFPKRPRQPFKDGESLKTWAFDESVISAPYERLLSKDVRDVLRRRGEPLAGQSPEGKEERLMRDLEMEQPEYAELENDFRV